MESSAQRHLRGSRPGIRPWAHLGSALLLAACFESSPVVEPGKVYDPDVFMGQIDFAGMDSVLLSLVDDEDSNRVLPLWSGRPDTGAKFPVHVARPGESFHFRVQGFRADRGACFLASVREGRPVVERSQCAPRPFTVDSLGILDARYTSFLKIRNTGRYTGWIFLVPRQKWIVPAQDSIWLDSTADSARTQINILTYLDRVLHESSVQIHDREGRLLETVAVKVKATYASIFDRDTLHLSPSSPQRDFSAITPITDNARWLDTPDLRWLFVHVFAVAVPQGRMAPYSVQMDPLTMPRDRDEDTLRIYARGADSVAIDSLVLHIRLK